MDRGQKTGEPIGKMMDPLLALFDRSSHALFTSGELTVTHGPVARLPQWMRSGALGNVSRLCELYRGTLEVARGPSLPPRPGEEFIGRGGQVRVQGARPEALLQLGLTVFFADIRDAVPESRVFLSELEAALGVPSCSVIGVFVNAPGSGLPLHHDSHDQLLIQLLGEKDFTYVKGPHARHPGLQFSPESRVHPDFSAIYGEALPARAEEIRERGVETLRLKPGSCLFLPAGCFHETVDQADVCMSLSIAVRPPSRADLILSALRARLLREPAFRAPSYGVFGDEFDSTSLQDQLTRAASLLGTLRPEALPEVTLERAVRDGDPTSHPHQNRFTRYLRIPSTIVRFEDASEGRIRVIVRTVHRLDENVLEIASVARPLVKHVLSSTQVVSKDATCHAFPEFEEEEITALLADLARVGLLRPVVALE